MIQNPSKDVTLIVYDTPKPPRYIRLNKVLMRYLVVIIPFLILLMLSGSFLYSLYLKNKVSFLKSKEPKVIQELKSDKGLLAQQITALEKANNELIQKLSKGTTVQTASSALDIFTAPLGMQDLRNKELITFDNINLTTAAGKIKLSFNLANNTSEKLSGHLFVIQYQGNLIQFYPDIELSENTLQLKYNAGESFGFSRFRPTMATFPKLQNASVKYKIFIYSRSGDLITLKQIGPYNIE